MANTNTNTTASLHWNVATPALKPARVTRQWSQNEQMDAMSDTGEAARRAEMKYRLKICVDDIEGGAGSRWKSFNKHFGKAKIEAYELRKSFSC